MRKQISRKINLLKLCIYIVTLSVSVTGCNKKIAGFPADLADQLPQTTNYNIHKFVLDDRLGFRSPVVRWNLNGEELFMLIDTGAYENGLFKNGIKKALPGYEITDILKQNKYQFSVTLENNEYCLDPYGVFMGGIEEEILDGWLGLEWMKQYNNFIFDYVNNRIDYNKSPITDCDIPMNWNDLYRYKYAIPFRLNETEMYGLLDTGCYCTMVNRAVFGAEKTESGLYIVNDFSIGNINFKNMELASVEEGGGAEGIKELFAVTNVLGYPCFKDHVIQLDFKNNVFRIK